MSVNYKNLIKRIPGSVTEGMSSNELEDYFTEVSYDILKEDFKRIIGKYLLSITIMMESLLRSMTCYLLKTWLNSQNTG